MTMVLAIVAAAATAALLSSPPPNDRRLAEVAPQPVRVPGRGGLPAARIGRPSLAEGGHGRRRPRPRGAGRPPGAAGDGEPWPLTFGEDTPWLLGPVPRTAMAAVAGLAVLVVVGGLPGAVGGSAVLLVLPRLLARLPDPSVAALERKLADDLPLALDLIAGCLAAGAPVNLAASAVGAELTGPLARVLLDVGGQLDLGAPADVAWARAARWRPLQPLVESVTRVGNSGAALGPALRRLAEDERDRARQAQEAAVRKVGVFVVIPLGICFLPAFLLLGVVPIVAGLVGGLLI